MVSQINRLLFGKSVREYVAVNLDEAAGNHAYSIVDREKSDQTGKEMLVSLDPLQLCIISEKKLAPEFWLQYLINGKTIARVHLEVLKNFGPSANYHLCLVRYSKFVQVNRIALLLFYYQMRKGKRRLTFKDYLGLAGMYAIPRPVILVSVSCGDFQSIFPMDLFLIDRVNRTVIMGLRTSNQMNNFLENPELRVTIGPIPFANREDAYSFSTYHSAAFPGIVNLPYEFYKSKVHKNNLPSFIIDHAELVFVEVQNAGLQNVIQLKVVSGEVGAWFNQLAHQHFLSWRE